MAAYLETMYAAFRTAINATWTDVAADGVWEYEHIDMVPWALLTPPMAVILLPAAVETDEWGCRNQSYNLMTEFYYVTAQVGSSSAIRAKLEAMRDYLIATGLAAGQVIDVYELNYSESLRPNQHFIDANRPHRAGMVRFLGVYIETP